jgi:hypothetical protein
LTLSRLITIGILLFSAANGREALAGEKLDFDQPVGARSRILLRDYATDQLKVDPATLRVARADLNSDGIDEFITIGTQCGNVPDTLCNITVLAETDEELIRLGAFKAHTILLGDGYSGGVRDLVVYRDEINDYHDELYVWEPRQSQYILSR